MRKKINELCFQLSGIAKKGEKTSKKKHGKARIKSQLQEVPNNSGMQRLQNQQVLHGNKMERIAIRKHILTQMNEISNNDKMYHSLIEKLIDKEESFVQ